MLQWELCNPPEMLLLFHILLVKACVYILKKSLDENITGLLTTLGKPGWDISVFLCISKVIKFGDSPFYLR